MTPTPSQKTEPPGVSTPHSQVRERRFRQALRAGGSAVLVTAVGEVQPHELVACVVEIHAHALPCSGCEDVLLDFRESSLNAIEIGHARELAGLLKDISSPHGRTAAVTRCSVDFGIMRQVETLMSGSPHQFSAFTCLEDAEGWLDQAGCSRCP